jgi:crotonobetainyl-CoA:carnitine CoA-transferase CaiB-like acyl-CoA transferase
MPSVSPKDAASGPASWLRDLLVVELGDRISVGACGSLLAQAGATVVLVERRTPRQARGKWLHRAIFAAGKQSLLIDDCCPQDVALLSDLLARADFVLRSSDMDEPPLAVFEDAYANASACVDFTAFGRTSTTQPTPPHSAAHGTAHGTAQATAQATARATPNPVYSDAMVQALSGVAHTSGFADGPPVALRMPVLEYCAAVYGATACMAALRSGLAQSVDMALFDCAINALSTFLPALYGDKEPGRVGNGHAMAAPWNAYPAKDGWLLLCSTTDAQWQRICIAMETPQYAEDPRFKGLNDRMINRDALDVVVGEWVQCLDVTACAEHLSALELACGSIVELDALGEEPNLAHRGMVHLVPDYHNGTQARIPGSVLRNATASGQVATHIVAQDENRAALQALCRTRNPRSAASANTSTSAAQLPLHGVRVLEVGQYTTAPLTARHLASLGAEVLKIEPPGGDVTREWSPCVNGVGIFFMMSNSGKKSVIIDLKSPQGRAMCEELMRSADVLVENLKPGSFARLGFGPNDLARINPRLIYCSISGFGNASVYQGRPAFDTVAQAMSGVMHANAHHGTPLKAGISVCDLMGGAVALFAVVAALHHRPSSGGGEAIDLSMQDVGAWMTAPLWNTDQAIADAHTDAGAKESADKNADKNADKSTDTNIDTNTIVACKDGYALVVANAEVAQRAASAAQAQSTTREQFAAALVAQGIACVPILRVSESATHPLVAERKLIRACADISGHDWPLLGSPMALSKTPPFVGDPIGAARELTQAMLDEGELVFDKMKTVKKS